MPDPLATPSKIAFVGDLHANVPWTEKVIRYAAEQGADVILQLGDYGYRFTPSFITRIEKALAAAALPLLFIDGNHDDHPWLNKRKIGPNGLRQISPHVWHIPRGFRWTWDGIRFVGLGGAHSVDRPWRKPGKSWWPEETITPEQAAEVIAGGRADVLISHDCPAGVVIPGIDDRTGPPPFPPLEILRSNENRALLRTVVDVVQPKLTIHGHYHDGAFQRYETTVDLGYGDVRVIGLDRDETSLASNVTVVDLADLGCAGPADA